MAAKKPRTRIVLPRAQRARRAVYGFTAAKLETVASGAIDVSAVDVMAKAADVTVDEIAEALRFIASELWRRTEGRAKYSLKARARGGAPTPSP